MKVSFDFDGTLNTPEGKQFAIELIQRGVEVIIVTSRHTKDFANQHYVNFNHFNDDIFEMMKELGIKEVFFTSHADKSETIDQHNVVWHLDNDDFEIDMINQDCKTKGILFFGGWKEECEKLLNNFVD